MTMPPASLPHIGLVLDALLGQIESPGPLPSLAMLGGLGGTARRLTAEQGTYAVTGQDAGSRRGIVMPAEQGYIALYGQVGLLQKGANSAGESVPLPHLATLFIPTFLSRTLTADPGSYNYNGSEALLDHELDADTSTYVLLGQDATLKCDLALSAEVGTYTLTGQDADSQRGGTALSMAADPGTYSITGNDAGLSSGYGMALEHGFYALLGQVAVLSVGSDGNTTLTAEGGTYTLSGQPASFATTGAPTVTPGPSYGDLSFTQAPPAERKRKKKPEEKSLRADIEEAFTEVTALPEKVETAVIPFIEEMKALVLRIEQMGERLQKMEDKQARAEKRRRELQQRLLID